ncbi:unnamed protein product, partial [Brassica oleracea var. botrytis]
SVFFSSGATELPFSISPFFFFSNFLLLLSHSIIVTSLSFLHCRSSLGSLLLLLSLASVNIPLLLQGKDSLRQWKKTRPRRKRN